ncbi:MAG: hypothetical protein KF700_04730 [Hyphomonadaceae bacterium]|nr:hypothetical protein [Hyphomonadaceae bacterium]
MLEHDPVLKERLTAVSVFAAIAIMGALSVDALVTGKLDVLTPEAAAEAPAPRAWYDRPLEPGQGWASEPYLIDAHVTHTTLLLPQGEQPQRPAQDLEGAANPAAEESAPAAYEFAEAADHDAPDALHQANYAANITVPKSEQNAALRTW